MAETQIRYDDPAGYERYMGVWSRLAGEGFLDWLAPARGLRWLDVGCGNGAFTELIVGRCAPVEIQGVDPSEAQIAYARERSGMRVAEFRQGNAIALPLSERKFDTAVMALVIFFVPEPEKGVAEMMRLTRPGGTIAAYAWDILGGGFPLEPILAGIRDMGLKPVIPPRSDAARMDALRNLWAGAGLEAVETREITVERTFANYDDFWTISLLSAGVRPVIAAMKRGEIERLKERARAHLPAAAADGRITYSARANAVKGRVPK